MLRTLPSDHKTRWNEHVNKVVHAYNCTRNDSTGFAPFHLMYGRTPRLTIDLIFGKREQEFKSSKEFAEKWKDCMTEAYRLASEHASSQSDRQKLNYDQKKIKATELLPGDRVLLRNLSERGGPGKLRSYWEHSPYTVLGTMNEDSPVYKIKSSKDGKTKVVHRNLLLPGDYLPIEAEPEPHKPMSKPSRQKRPNQQDQPAPDSESSDDEEYGYFPREINTQRPETNTQPINTVDETESSLGNDSGVDPTMMNSTPVVVSQPVNQTTTTADGTSGLRRSTRIRQPPAHLTYNVDGSMNEWRQTPPVIRYLQVNPGWQVWNDPPIPVPVYYNGPRYVQMI